MTAPFDPIQSEYFRKLRKLEGDEMTTNAHASWVCVGWRSGRPFQHALHLPGGGAVYVIRDATTGLWNVHLTDTRGPPENAGQFRLQDAKRFGESIAIDTARKIIVDLKRRAG